MSVLSLSLAACDSNGQGESQQVPPVSVGIEVATRQDLPLPLAYSARTAGSREVEVRARVTGIIERRLYTEGSEVRAGTPLFRIDPAPFRAATEQARAELGVEQARLDAARRERDRIVSLAAEGLVSQRQRDEAVSAFEIAEASVASAAARLRLAEIDLGYTEVRAPISGLTSREQRSVGSLVNAGDDDSLLTRMVQLDPLYVGFAVPTDEAAWLREALARGQALKVRVLTSQGALEQLAEVDFVDPAVDVQSATVLVRATIGNADRRLMPGQFVRAVVEGLSHDDVLAVPRRALVSGAQGQSLWVVDAQGLAQSRPVKVAKQARDWTIIASGLEPGERYIVDGIMKLQPGTPVVAAGQP